MHITRNHFLFVFYFASATVISWLFIAVSPLYISERQMYLSMAVAGSKWGVQIVFALLFLKKKTWVFLCSIGFVCFIGSVTLLPYIALSKTALANGSAFFIGSISTAVLVMVVEYYRAMRLSSVSIRWWLFWLGCLIIAVTLQLTVVFAVI